MATGGGWDGPPSSRLRSSTDPAAAEAALARLTRLREERAPRSFE
ncbi:hypothetical protein ACWDX6_09600 [Streptomyces sp. NPDC003027]